MDLSEDIHKSSIDNVYNITNNTSNVSIILTEEKKDDSPDNNTVESSIQSNCKCNFQIYSLHLV